MKRLWVILGALAVFCAVSVTEASAAKLFRNLQFRTHKAAIVGNEGPGYGVDALGGFVDSTYIQRLGIAAVTVAARETTVAFSLMDIPSVSALGDSTLACQLIVYDANSIGAVGTSQASMDSMYLLTQVSPDGVNWGTCAVDPTVAPGRFDATSLVGFQIPGQAAPNSYGMLTQTGAGVAGQFWTHKFTVGGAAMSTADVWSLNKWPYVRFILGFSDAGGYKVRAKIAVNESVSSN